MKQIKRDLNQFLKRHTEQFKEGLEQLTKIDLKLKEIGEFRIKTHSRPVEEPPKQEKFVLIEGRVMRTRIQNDGTKYTKILPSNDQFIFGFIRSLSNEVDLIHLQHGKFLTVKLPVNFIYIHQNRIFCNNRIYTREEGFIQSFPHDDYSCAIEMDEHKILMAHSTWTKMQVLEWDHTSHKYLVHKALPVKCIAQMNKDIYVKKMIQVDSDYIGLFGKELAKINPLRMKKSKKQSAQFSPRMYSEKVFKHYYIGFEDFTLAPDSIHYIILAEKRHIILFDRVTMTKKSQYQLEALLPTYNLLLPNNFDVETLPVILDTEDNFLKIIDIRGHNYKGSLQLPFGLEILGKYQNKSDFMTKLLAKDMHGQIVMLELNFS
ncbi:hypothetical protein FGO68_gene4409 [Halteria grandinella]|uniref:Uncharacterized protein n=1 Tax=Halteria grandinella TaxID=5974 RepID=A0A8J8P7L1_HALGN|nr:hypothetical protein FGO68_gene4409 [Halteria grandinella]